MSNKRFQRAALLARRLSTVVHYEACAIPSLYNTGALSAEDEAHAAHLVKQGGILYRVARWIEDAHSVDLPVNLREDMLGAVNAAHLSTCGTGMRAEHCECEVAELDRKFRELLHGCEVAEVACV